VQFDSEARVIRSAPKESPGWLIIVGFTILSFGLILLVRFLAEEPDRGPVIIRATPEVMLVRIVEDETDPTKTPTPQPCQPLLPIGTPCYFTVSPTPLANCPPLVGNSMCIYIGPESWMTPTPSDASGSAVSPPFS
jgi:hypothetical protein